MIFAYKLYCSHCKRKVVYETDVKQTKTGPCPSCGRKLKRVDEGTDKDIDSEKSSS